MDGTRFDGWTRRQVGLIAGGLFASIGGLASLGDSEARKGGKKRGKQRKQNQTAPAPAITRGQLGSACTPGQTLCCDQLLCIKVIKEGAPSPFACCKGEGLTCQDNDECCGGLGLTCFEGICQIEK